MPKGVYEKDWARAKKKATAQGKRFNEAYIMSIYKSLRKGKRRYKKRR